MDVWRTRRAWGENVEWENVKRIWKNTQGDRGAFGVIRDGRRIGGENEDGVQRGEQESWEETGRSWEGEIRGRKTSRGGSPVNRYIW